MTTTISNWGEQEEGPALRRRHSSAAATAGAAAAAATAEPVSAAHSASSPPQEESWWLCCGPLAFSDPRVIPTSSLIIGWSRLWIRLAELQVRLAHKASSYLPRHKAPV